MTSLTETANPADFTGAMTALITPFQHGLIDTDAMRTMVDFQIDEGIDGLVVCGTTGEAVTMTSLEVDEVIRLVVDQAAGRVPVIAGTGSNCTATTIERTRAAARAGADAALVVVPYYNKPTQTGMIRHFTMVADAAPLPIMLYNVPGRTGVNMTAETTLHLADHAGIVAIKEASGDLDQVSEIIRSAPAPFSVLSGDDSLTLPMMAVGGRGVISVVSNVAPGLVASMTDTINEGDFETARRLHLALLPLCKAMFLENNPTAVKAAAAIMGLCEAETRPPLAELAVGNLAIVERELMSAGLIEPVSMVAD